MASSHRRTSLRLVVILIICIQASPVESTSMATCQVIVNPRLAAGIKDKVTGTITLTQPQDGNTTLHIELSGFDTRDVHTRHGFHVHISRDMQDGCNSLGGHFNPTGHNHGSPNDVQRHYGDVGALTENSEGAVSTTIVDRLVSLVGQDSVLSRSIVIHQMMDDFGRGGDAESLKTGNSGKRIACCVIVPSSASSTFPVFSISLLTAFAVSGLTKTALL